MNRSKLDPRLEMLLDFAPGTARLCAKLSNERYRTARGRGGYTAAYCIANMVRELLWCAATLEGRAVRVSMAKPPAQSTLERRMSKACDELLLVTKKLKSSKSLDAMVILREPEFKGMIALRADTIVTATVTRYYIWQYHLQRAFYTFDRESGGHFFGGGRHHLETYSASVLSKLIPIA